MFCGQLPYDPSSIGPQLLERARDGDHAAWRQLFRDTRPKVAAVVRRYVEDPVAVDDVVQEVFVAAYAGVRRFRGQASIGTWLHRIEGRSLRRLSEEMGVAISTLSYRANRAEHVVRVALACAGAA